MSEAIVFVASVYKVQTLVDNGIRLTLDLPETAIPQMAQLAACQRDGVALAFTAVEAMEQTTRRKSTAEWLEASTESTI